MMFTYENLKRMAPKNDAQRSTSFTLFMGAIMLNAILLNVVAPVGRYDNSIQPCLTCPQGPRLQNFLGYKFFFGIIGYFV